MPPTHISGTSRALYRVFIAPNLRTSTTIPLLYCPAFAPNTRSTPSLTSRTSIREKKYTKDTRRHALSDYYVIDSAIEADVVNVVNADGTFHNGVPLDEALRSINKTTHHLVQLTPGKFDEAGRPDPENLPTCRVISKIDLRAQHERKLELMRRQEKGRSGTGPTPKSLELNWAIAPGDLKHRLESIKRFLREGRKVEVMLGPKVKGKKATQEEAEAVMKRVREAVGECKGSKEVKSEGQVGGVITVTFEGKKMEKQVEEKKEEKKEETHSEEEV
jgi:translation initiation factor IF-3